MKNLFALIALACFSTAFAGEIPQNRVPYNLCADKTKTDCEVLHMPTFGQIDSAAGHETFTCGAACEGNANSKAVGAIAILSPKAGDLDSSHYITFEGNSKNVVYTQVAENVYERILAQEDNNLLTLKYCTFYTDNIAASIENYKKDHEGVQAGPSVIDNEAYNNLKTAFQAQEDTEQCNDFELMP